MSTDSAEVQFGREVTGGIPPWITSLDHLEDFASRLAPPPWSSKIQHCSVSFVTSVIDVNISWGSKGGHGCPTVTLKCNRIVVVQWYREVLFVLIVHNLEEKWGNTKVNVPRTNTLDHTHCSLSHNVYWCMIFFSVSVCCQVCCVVSCVPLGSTMSLYYYNMYSWSWSCLAL